MRRRFMINLTQARTICRPAWVGPTLCSRRAQHSATRFDPWKTLGIEHGCAEDDAKEAFRCLALQYHPDVNHDPDAALKFAEIVHAYQKIATGAVDSDGVGPRAAFMRGRHTIGGVLVVTMAELRRDPNYHVYTLRLALDRESTAHASTIAEDDPHARTASDALAYGADIVHEVHASQWDSVGDLRRQLQTELHLPPKLRYEHTRHREGGHEIIAAGGLLLGEHLFLADYGVSDGDTLHFAVHQGGTMRR